MNETNHTTVSARWAAMTAALMVLTLGCAGPEDRPSTRRETAISALKIRIYGDIAATKTRDLQPATARLVATEPDDAVLREMAVAIGDLCWPCVEELEASLYPK